MNTTETKTFPVGTSRAGTTHRVYVANSGHFYNRAACMDGVIGNNRAWLGQMRNVETGNTPSGKLCKKCFPEEGAR